MNELPAARTLDTNASSGTVFRSLSELGNFIRGHGLQKADLTSAGVPAIHYGQIHTYYGAWADRTKSFTKASTAASLKRARFGDLIIATTSEDDAAVAKGTAWLGSDEVVVGGDAYIFRHELEPRYVAYFLESEAFQVQKYRHITGAKVRRISAEALGKIRIPVPTLERQQEIASTLDELTDKKTRLAAALGSELEARRRQHAHYRQSVLTFASDVPRVGLKEVADYVNGKAHEKLADPDGTVAMVTARFISTNGDARRFVRPDDVLVGARPGDVAMVLSDLPNGRALARTFFVEMADAYAINQRVARLRVTDEARLLPKFLYYILDRNPDLMKYDNGVDQTHLSKSQVTDLRIPVPQITEQRRVIDLLDEFSALLSDLTVSLSAEITARQEQYEFYRNRFFAYREFSA